MKSVGWGSGLWLCQASGLLACVMKPGPLLWHDQPQLPVCLPTLSQWTHSQLDSSAIFAAINAIRLERKSINGVHLCCRVEEKILSWDKAVMGGVLVGIGLLHIFHIYVYCIVYNICDI